MVKPYRIALVQTAIRPVSRLSERDAVVRQNLDRSLEIAEETIVRGGAQLILFPEFWLHGAFNYDWSAAEWEACALDLERGWEIQVLGEWAARHGVYVAGAAFERHPAFPGRVFNTGFLVDPSGSVVLRHRKHYCGQMNGLLAITSPGDVYDRFVEVFGEDALFPVARTPLGTIGMIVCYEINFFEVTRILALKGAELILHPTGEPHAPHRAGWEQARRTRAYENNVYLASCNHGQILGSRMAEFRSWGRSEVVGYDGKILAAIEGPGEATLVCDIDLTALRLHRDQVRMNFLAQSRIALYRRFYEHRAGFPLNAWADQPIRHRHEGAEKVRETIRRYQESGVFVRPGVLGE